MKSAQNPSAELLCLGEALFELSEVEQEGDTLFRPGFGGDVSNVAVAAARQGASVGMLTRLGDDDFGRRFLDLWRREGIDAALVKVDEAAPTGVYFIGYRDGDHHFSYLRRGSAASRMTPQDVPEEAIAASRIIHLSGISQAISSSACDAMFAAIAAARSNRVLVSYDTNLRLQLWPLPRARAVIMETIGQCDYCLPSLDDARRLTGRDDPEAIVEVLLAAGARQVLLKMGSAGVLLATPDCGPQLLPGMPVDAVDATGAGDCFDGAFLAEVLRGSSLVEAARWANATAALSTLAHGAVTPLPRRDEVTKFMAGAVPPTR